MRKSSRFLSIALAAALFYAAQAGAGLVGDEVLIRAGLGTSYDDNSPIFEETVNVVSGASELEGYFDGRFDSDEEAFI